MALAGVFPGEGGQGGSEQFQMQQCSFLLFFLGEREVILNYTLLQDEALYALRSRLPVGPGPLFLGLSSPSVEPSLGPTAPQGAPGSPGRPQPVGTGEVSSTEIVNHVTVFFWFHTIYFWFL